MTQIHNPANNLSDLPILTEVIEQSPDLPVLTDIVADSTPSTAELQQLLQTLSPAIEARLRADVETHVKTLTRQIVRHTLAELGNNPDMLLQVLSKTRTK